MQPTFILPRKPLVRALCVLLFLAGLTSCGGGGGGGGDGIGGNQLPAEKNSNWDTMVWDQDSWS